MTADLEFVESVVLIEELLKRHDAGIVACWSNMSDNHDRVILKFHGGYIPIIGLMQYVQNGLDTVIERAEGEGEGDQG